jgi:hypothetical protein
MFLRLLRWRTKLPTVLHFTHIKAGSTWVDRILRHLFAERTLPRFGSERFEGLTAPDTLAPEVNYLAMYAALPVKPGHIYPGLMLTKEDFLERGEFADARRFAVIRDLRDTLVSHYFSLRNEHAQDKHGRVREAREKLQSLDLENGLLYLIERDLDRLVAIQRSWLAAGEVLARYEDLLLDDIAGFERLLVDRLELPVPRRHVRAAVEACRFDKLTGRQLGENDPTAHARQGLPGDWRNHFTKTVAEGFIQKSGDLLVSSGYEPDSSWAEKLGVSRQPKLSYRTSILHRSREAVASDFTLIHLTHAKAGSSWIFRILRELFPDRIAPRGRKVAEATGGDLSKHVFESGRIYAAMFMRAEEFDAHPELGDALRFVVIRDLRDTLVSLYFSVKVSHPLDAEGKRQRERETLESLSTEDGLLRIIETQLGGVAELQRSWVGRNELLYRYEELLPRDYTLLRELLMERFRLPISEKSLRAALGKYSFESQYGRKLGEEDASSHGRQGAPGNWRKHFTPRVTEAFEQRFGQVLIDTGYERDLSWAKLAP